MSAGASAPAPAQRLTGALHVFGAYFLYAVGDAAAKWLVGSVSVWEVLFLRSWLSLLLLLALAGRRVLASLRELRGEHGLLGMNLANFCGWSAYYFAATALPLPQLYTAYYLSPIFASLLAGPMLHERIAAASWVAAALGFAGVVVTVSPGHAPLPAFVPAALGVASALFWALSSVLYRRHVHRCGALLIVVYSNLVIGTLSAVPLAWNWRGLDGASLGIVAGVAVAALGAHFLYISGLRRVPVAVAGTIGFFSLVWSVVLAYLIWGEVPRAGFFAGGAMIVGAGLIVIGSEWRRARKSAPGQGGGPAGTRVRRTSGRRSPGRPPPPPRA